MILPEHEKWVADAVIEIAQIADRDWCMKTETEQEYLLALIAGVLAKHLRNETFAKLEKAQSVDSH
jgi:hypothetical protein